MFNFLRIDAFLIVLLSHGKIEKLICNNHYNKNNQERHVRIHRYQ